MDRHANIINAASNLLGICFLIITGLSLTRSNGRSLADEIAWVAAVCFLVSLSLAYVTVRHQDERAWTSIWADRIFMVGVGALTLSTLVLGFAIA